MDKICEQKGTIALWEAVLQHSETQESFDKMMVYPNLQEIAKKDLFVMRDRQLQLLQTLFKDISVLRGITVYLVQ